MNDSDNLYMFFSTEDKDIQSQITGRMGQSFTVWFFAPGNEQNKIGFKFKSKAGKPPEGSMDRRFLQDANNGLNEKAENKNIVLICWNLYRRFCYLEYIMVARR